MAMDEALIKRILPHSDEAERAVIGSMLMDGDAIVTASEIIGSDDFYQRQYGILFDVMTELYGEDKPVDLVTLQERLKNKDVPPELTSVEFISGILNDVPTSANVKHYAETVAEKALLRRMIKTNEEIANSCYLGKEPLDQILEDTEKKIFDLLQKKSSIRGGPIASTTTSREYSSPLLPTRSCAINVIVIIDASTRWQIIAVRLQRAISDNVLLSICHSSVHLDTILLL